MSQKLSSPATANTSKLYNHFGRFLTRRLSHDQWTMVATPEDPNHNNGNNSNNPFLGSVYTPKNHVEEGILLLLLYGDSNEFKSGFSQNTNGNTSDHAYFDDLAILYGKRSAHKRQVETYERLLSMSYGETEVLFNFACSLFASKQYKKAYKALEHCTSMPNQELSVYLLQAKLAINHMHHTIPDVISTLHNRLLISSASKEDEYLLGQLYHSLGLCYSILASSF